MTARTLIPIDIDVLEAVAYKHGLPIERSADEQRVYVVCEVDGMRTTFWAPCVDKAVA